MAKELRPSFHPPIQPTFYCLSYNSLMRRTLVLLLGLILAVPVHAARQPVRAKHGMVVAMESIAVDVGVSVLQQGGNAVDAAVAVGFAMAVTHPYAGNIGKTKDKADLERLLQGHHEMWEEFRRRARRKKKMRPWRPGEEPYIRV